MFIIVHALFTWCVFVMGGTGYNVISSRTSKRVSDCIFYSRPLVMAKLITVLHLATDLRSSIFTADKTETRTWSLHSYELCAASPTFEPTGLQFHLPILHPGKTLFFTVLMCGSSSTVLLRCCPLEDTRGIARSIWFIRSFLFKFANNKIYKLHLTKIVLKYKYVRV